MHIQNIRIFLSEHAFFVKTENNMKDAILKTQATDYQSAPREMQSEAPLQQVKKKF